MKFKHYLYSGLLASALVLSASALGNEDVAMAQDEPEKPESLTVWLDGDVQFEVYPEIFARFTEETGIEVNVTEIAMNDQLDQMSLDAPAGNGPDIFQQPHDMIGSAFLQGLAKEINPEDVEDLDLFNENAIDAFTYDGHLLGLPFAAEAIALYYNTDLIDAPPTTKEELEALMEEFTDESNNEYGFLMESTNFYMVYAFLFSGDERIFSQDEDGSYDASDIQVTSEGVIEQAEAFQSYFEAGYLSPNINGDVLDGLFLAGDSPVALTGPWKLAEYSAALGDSLATAPLPEFDGEPMTPFMGVKGWMLNEYTDNEYWALELLKFMTNQESSQYVVDNMQESVPRSDVENDNELLATFDEQTANAVPMPNIPEMAQVWEPMENALVFISQGEDVTEILEEAKQQIEDNIEAAGGQSGE